VRIESAALSVVEVIIPVEETIEYLEIIL